MSSLATVVALRLERQVEILELFAEAQRLQRHKLRRSFPLFILSAWRSTIVYQRLCLTCRGPVRRVGASGPLPIHCSDRCAKHGYNASDRKRLTRARWAKARRDRLRAAGCCLGCGCASPGRAYCGDCRSERRRR